VGTGPEPDEAAEPALGPPSTGSRDSGSATGGTAALSGTTANTVLTCTNAAQPDYYGVLG
jgi:hypothetical protein